MPVVSSDGRRALVYIDESCGITCGAGFILHLARQPNGEWRVLDSRGLWVA